MSETSATFTGILLLILVLILLLLFLYHYVYGNRERFWSNTCKEEKVGFSHKLFKPNGYMVCMQFKILQLISFNLSVNPSPVLCRSILVLNYFLALRAVLNASIRSIKKIITFRYNNSNHNSNHNAFKGSNILCNSNNNSNS